MSDDHPAPGLTTKPTAAEIEAMSRERREPTGIAPPGGAFNISLAHGASEVVDVSGLSSQEIINLHVERKAAVAAGRTPPTVPSVRDVPAHAPVVERLTTSWRRQADAAEAEGSRSSLVKMAVLRRVAGELDAAFPAPTKTSS